MMEGGRGAGRDGWWANEREADRDGGWANEMERGRDGGREGSSLSGSLDGTHTAHLL